MNFYSISDLIDNVPLNYREITEKLKYSFYDNYCVTGTSNTVE